MALCNRRLHESQRLTPDGGPYASLEGEWGYGTVKPRYSAPRYDVKIDTPPVCLACPYFLVVILFTSSHNLDLPPKNANFNANLLTPKSIYRWRLACPYFFVVIIFSYLYNPDIAEIISVMSGTWRYYGSLTVLGNMSM